MKTVLVTGARGFVGHSIVSRILEKTDWFLVCPVRDSKSQDRLKELGQTSRIVYEFQGKIDIIIHAAAEPSTLVCIEDPVKAVNSNIIETLKILEFARTQSLEHFIFISSTGVYDNTGKSSREDTLCTARNMYAATKLSCEQMCMAYLHSYNVPCSIARLSDVFGPRSQKTRLPTVALNKLLNDETFVIHCCKGEVVAKRNWCSSVDVADMILFILSQNPGRTYNVSGRECMSNLDFIKEIAKCLNKTVKYELGYENIQGRNVAHDAPPDLIWSLGWRPEKPFEERVAEFVKWTLEHPAWY